MIVASAALLFKTARPEEQSILDQATVFLGDISTPDPNALISTNFKSFTRTETGSLPDKTSEFKIDLKEIKAIHSIMVSNICTTGVKRLSLGVSHVRVGNDEAAYSTNNPVVLDDIVEGGFFEFSSLASGRYLDFRRDGCNP